MMKGKRRRQRVKDQGMALVFGIILVVAGTCVTMAASPPRGSSMEPGEGQLASGQSMLIDDGTCPAGQIKQITGGDMNRGVHRSRICVRRRP